MSGYFGALMRSSGLATAAGRAAAPIPVAPAVSEISGEDTVDGPPPVVQGPRQPQPAAEPAAVRQPATEFVPTPRVAAPLHEVHETVSVPQRRERVGMALADLPETWTRAAGPPTSLEHAMVRAALNWVRAGTPTTPSGEAEPAPEHRAAASEHRAMIDTTEAIREHSVRLASPFVAPTREPLTRDRAAVRESDTQQVTPALTPRPATPNVTVPPGAVMRDERVEISIGAIHVRVDGPAAQTVAQPATSSPASVPRPTATPGQRSALSRRALRRI